MRTAQILDPGDWNGICSYYVGCLGYVVRIYGRRNYFAARVGRNEEAQIYLAESSNRVKSDQDAILARVSKIRPVKRAALALVGVMTLVVVGYYLFDIFHQF